MSETGLNPNNKRNNKDMLHTSPNQIVDGTINDDGVAGSCLFFSNNIYRMSKASIFVYEADFNCIRANQLYDETIIADIADRFSVDIEIAEGLLDGCESEWDHGAADGELSWWLQGKRGECAVNMGYDGCEDFDEHGTVYIVPMKGRELELKLVKVLE